MCNWSDSVVELLHSTYLKTNILFLGKKKKPTNQKCTPSLFGVQSSLAIEQGGEKGKD